MIKNRIFTISALLKKALMGLILCASFATLTSFTDQTTAKNNLKLYTFDDGTGGHSFINWHLLNKSAEHRITCVLYFKTDGQWATSWQQTITLDKSEDRIISAAHYEGDTNSVFCTIHDAWYAVDDGLKHKKRQ